jgi:deoxyinosine 3'endonuclease (endonuclease V)
MHLNRRHSWDLSPSEAIALQQELRREVVSNQPIDLDAVKLVAGVDVSVKNEQSQAAIVVVTFPGFLLVETVLAQRPTPFPYVPGLLSFREGPVLEEAFEKLQSKPDVFLFDGMGIAHPRRIGIASHMGLWLERPTIGCGKTCCAAVTRILERRRVRPRLSSTGKKPSAWLCAPARPRTPCSSRPDIWPTFQRRPNSCCAVHQSIACPNRSAWRTTRLDSSALNRLEQAQR